MTTTTTMTKDQILKVLEYIGKELAWHADAGNYRHEDRGRAGRYEAQVKAARNAYRLIRKGADAVLILNRLKQYVQGTEWNALNLLLGAIAGDQRCLNHPYICDCLLTWKFARPILEPTPIGG